MAGETESMEKVPLDSLIEDRIERAIKLADFKGAKSGAIDSFLCALAVLPPPVPVDEMALAFGLSKGEASSLAADLAPLLERTKHGLIFRDEPTETLVKRKYASKLSLMDAVVARLAGAQAHRSMQPAPFRRYFQPWAASMICDGSRSTRAFRRNSIVKYQNARSGLFASRRRWGRPPRQETSMPQRISW